jgi:rhodanese-related sulfurtransferase
MKNYIKLFSIGLALIVLSSCGETPSDAKYELSPKEALAYVQTNEDVIPMDELADMYFRKADYPNVQFIDLRTPLEFDANHMPGAVNIPLKSLVMRDNCSVMLINDKVNVLYGKTGDQAFEAGLLLKQVGINNFKICPADYSFLKNNLMDKYDVETGVYDNEIARYDYAKVVAETAGAAASAGSSSAPAPAKPIIKRKKKEAGGGGCD